ncbi:An1-type Zinc finger protein 3 [Plakobranchus ocellatus]|uniref:An1-type Zinc finger protein 3 n=1 Tax=Plakobranchus ocellatus TaxID=259542 RepID=A0AAV3ZRG3_9GAST|nr:An1-type Zinc finger protein 3 [Plakobranchus ocellatus]
MEDSSNDTKPRCQCGFWGSSQTLGLCSVCYRKACRNQSQGSSLTPDANKSGVGSCHTQTQQNNCQGTKMDSRHFPSRSTTDNLPTPLSSPPGERASLSSPATAISDTSTTTPTTTSSSNTTTGATSSHLPNLMSPEAKGSAGGNDLPAPAAISIGAANNLVNKPQVTGEEQQQILPLISSSSDIDTRSSASSDLSYDPEHDTGLLCPSASDSCSSSLVSVANSTSSAILNHPPSVTSSSLSIASTEMMPVTFHASGPQPSSAKDEVQLQTFSADGSASTMQPQISNTVTTSRPKIATITASSISSNNAIGSSSQSKNAHCGDKTDKESSYKCKSSIASCSQPSEADNLGQPVSSLISFAERGTKRSRDEMEASSVKASPTLSPQKNRKRCFVCSCKLELAQRTIGKCRCDLVFCALHRLPELHDCEFNHKEDGRREAREKMIKPTRHLGPSYRREDNS